MATSTILTRGYAKWERKAAAAYAANKANKRQKPSYVTGKKRTRSPLRSSDLWKDEMPKRGRKTAVSRGRSGSKRRNVGARAGSSAYRLKTTAGTRGRRLKRFGRKFKRGRKGFKSLIPKWFITLTKGLPPTQVTGTFANRFITTAPVSGGTILANNNEAVWTHWKHLSLTDVQIALDANPSLTTANSGGQTGSSFNAVKGYLTALCRKHTWRSALQGGEMELQFYQLIPRRDLPAAINGAVLPQISPAVTQVYETGGASGNPPPMYSRPFTDESAGVTLGGVYANQKIGSNQMMTTPFMSPLLTENFKIMPFKVQGPSGMASLHRLQPGQECFYEGKYRGPHMVSMNKYLLTGATAANINGTWEIRKGMPLIFCQARGTPSHDPSATGTIGANQQVSLGPVAVDYFQGYRFNLWYPTPVKATTIFATTSALTNDTLGAPVLNQVDVVNALDTAETQA